MTGGGGTAFALLFAATVPVCAGGHGTGGTGRYAKVRGQSTSTPTGGNTSRDAFELDH